MGWPIPSFDALKKALTSTTGNSKNSHHICDEKGHLRRRWSLSPESFLHRTQKEGPIHPFLFEFSHVKHLLRIASPFSNLNEKSDPLFCRSGLTTTPNSNSWKSINHLQIIPWITSLLIKYLSASWYVWKARAVASRSCLSFYKTYIYWKGGGKRFFLRRV